jgi:hypothetical protein
MTERFRVIGFEDVRDAMEKLLTVDLADDELRERGVALTEYETLMDGLGPSIYTLIELTTKEQYLLHRLDYRPEVLNVDASLDEVPARLLSASSMRSTWIEWKAGDEFWNETRRGYDREKWLERRRGLI